MILGLINANWLVRPLRIPFIPRLRDPLTIKKPVRDLVFWYGFALVMAALIPVFFWIVEPSFTGNNGLRIGADSSLYLWYAGLDSDSTLLRTAYNVEQPYPDEITLIALSGNLIGPWLIATTLKSNLLIMLFNYALFFISLHYLFSLSGVRPKMLVVLLLANPITAVSIMTLNKEIIVLLASALLAYYLESRSRIVLLIALAVSMVARWEQAACVIIFLLLLSRLNPWRNRRGFTIALVILGITVIYPQIASVVNPIFTTTNEVGGGLMTSLGWLQEHYLFPLALIPKMLMNLFGTFLTMLYVKNWNWSDVQNSFIGPLSGVLLVINLFVLAASKQLQLRKNLIYYALLFIVILSASPFLQPRYMYSVYIFACIELSRVSVATQPRSQTQPELEY